MITSSFISIKSVMKVRNARGGKKKEGKHKTKGKSSNLVLGSTSERDVTSGGCSRKRIG